MAIPTLTQWSRDKMAAISRPTFFKVIVFYENGCILIKSSLKFIPLDPIINIPTLFQVKASCRPGNKPLCEPMAVRLLTHISVTRLQWINYRPCYLGTSNTSSGLVSLIMRCTYNIHVHNNIAIAANKIKAFALNTDNVPFPALCLKHLPSQTCIYIWYNINLVWGI